MNTPGVDDQINDIFDGASNNNLVVNEDKNAVIDNNKSEEEADDDFALRKIEPLIDGQCDEEDLMGFLPIRNTNSRSQKDLQIVSSI